MKNLLLSLLAVLAIATASADSYQYPLGVLANAGAPGNGTSEVQTVTLAATSGNLTTLVPAVVTLGFRGKTASLTITAEDTNGTLDTKVAAALDTMSTVKAANVTVATTGTTTRVIGLTYKASLGKQALPQLTSTVVSGNVTATAATGTPGVTATGLTTKKGALLVDETNARLYINAGAPYAPSWVVVGPAL